MPRETITDSLHHLYPKHGLEFLVAGIALLFYDYALTLGSEIRLVWKALMSIAKVLSLMIYVK